MWILETIVPMSEQESTRTYVVLIRVKGVAFCTR